MYVSNDQIHSETFSPWKLKSCSRDGKTPPFPLFIQLTVICVAAQSPTQHIEETHQKCFGYIIMISSIPYKSWIFLVKRKEMGELSNYTACLCAIKETCSGCSPGWESHSSTGTSSGTASGSKAEWSLRRLLCLYCLWFQSVLPSSRSIKCSLQKSKWLTASRALYNHPKRLVSPFY